MGLGVNSVLGELLRRGDIVAVEGGRLMIQFASGERPTKPWLKQNRSQLIKDVARLTGREILEFCQYSTGRYRFGERAEKAEKLISGVTLSYGDVLSGQTYRMCFNAELTYAKDTCKKQKGQELPKGRFRVKRRSSLITYWEKVGFSMPRRLSEFHEHLGKLSEVLITAEINNGVALDKSSCSPLELSHTYLLGCLEDQENLGNDSAISRQALGNMSAKPRQESSASISPQLSADVVYSGKLVHGQKSANNKQRNQERASSEGYRVSLPPGSSCREFVYTRAPGQSVDDYVEASLRQI
ncbi:MAG: hypothetical protein U1F46_07350 [Marinagarivorans sp.]